MSLRNLPHTFSCGHEKHYITMHRLPHAHKVYYENKRQNKHRRNPGDISCWTASSTGAVSCVWFEPGNRRPILSTEQVFTITCTKPIFTQTHTQRRAAVQNRIQHESVSKPLNPFHWAHMFSPAKYYNHSLFVVVMASSAVWNWAHEVHQLLLSSNKFSCMRCCLYIWPKHFFLLVRWQQSNCLANTEDYSHWAWLLLVAMHGELVGSFGRWLLLVVGQHDARHMNVKSLS